MTECNYWLDDGPSQWCDLAGRACNCSGDNGKCSFSSGPIFTALKAERQATFLENSPKAQKKRNHGELNTRER